MFLWIKLISMISRFHSLINADIFVYNVGKLDVRTHSIITIKPNCLKPHLIITLQQPLNFKVPNWEKVLLKKEGIPESFIPEVDRIVKDKYKRNFWVTYNFKPAGDTWTPTEIKSDFNKIFRLILQRDTDIPEEMVNEIKLLPEVVAVHSSNIAKIDLPDNQLVHTASLSARYRKNGIYLKEAHAYSKGDADIKIAILDTGFELSHPELRDTFLPGKDFVNIINGSKQFIGDFFLFADTAQSVSIGLVCIGAGL